MDHLRSLQSLLIFSVLLFLFGCGQVENPGLQDTELAALWLIDGPLYDFGDVAVGTPVTKTLTLMNKGPVAATSIGGTLYISSFSYVGGAFPGAGGTCTSSLASQESCTLEVQFQPNYPAQFEELVRISYYNNQKMTSTDQETTGRLTLRGMGI